jgi:hypothetical protein
MAVMVLRMLVMALGIEPDVATWRNRSEHRKNFHFNSGDERYVHSVDGDGYVAGCKYGWMSLMALLIAVLELGIELHQTKCGEIFSTC